MKPFKFFNKNNFIYDDDIRDFLMGGIPPYIVACGEISAYMDGINAGLTSMGYNPYNDNMRGEIWNRGFWNATNLKHRPNETI